MRFNISPHVIAVKGTGDESTYFVSTAGVKLCTLTQAMLVVGLLPNSTISQIKILRAFCDIGLMEAKQIVDFVTFIRK